MILGEKLRRQFCLSVGLALFLGDCGSDIYVATQYRENGEMWWFSWTVLLVILPSIMVNITSIVHEKLDKPKISFWKCVVAFLQLSLIVRFIKAISMKSPKPKRTFFLAKLRYMETITESTPQLCLQVYIMLRQWSFPRYTIVSSVFSFLSLVCSILTLENERAKDKEASLTLCEMFVFLIWQMFALIARLSVLVCIVYMSSEFISVCSFALIQFAFLFWLHLRFDSSYADWSHIIYLIFSAYPGLFHSMSLKGILPIKITNPEAKMIVTYILIVAENASLMAIFLTVEIPHADVLKRIALWSYTGGTVISLLAFLSMMRGFNWEGSIFLPGLNGNNFQSRTQSFQDETEQCLNTRASEIVPLSSATQAGDHLNNEIYAECV